MNKFQIRKKIIKIKKQNNSKDLKIDFSSILKIIKKSKNKSKIIGGYHYYNYEINVSQILKKLKNKNYQISLPKIKKNSQMDFFLWSKKDPFKINKFGIPEPTSDKIVYPGILLVPIVAFDKNFNRIGYGGGFYDRYIKKIKKIKNVTTIGLAYSFQKVKKVPTNKFDIKLDFVVTD